jgi:hypothetical protein
MAAVFDGDPGPLYDIILDRDADEYSHRGSSMTCTQVASDRVMQTPFLAAVSRIQCTPFAARSFAAAEPLQIAICKARELAINDLHAS